MGERVRGCQGVPARLEPVHGDADAGRARGGPVPDAGHRRGEHVGEPDARELPAAEPADVGARGAAAGWVWDEVCAWVLGACDPEGFRELSIG